MPEIFSTYYASPVGMLKISSTDAYITEVLFWHTGQNIFVEHGPSREIPLVLQQCVDELMEYFHGVRRIFEVPVHQDGSAFQAQVWSELLNIPYGKSISYLELSRRIGNVKAIRAAAATNGKNRIAVIVPCHRVIGSNSDLVGYAGGIWKKMVIASRSQDRIWRTNIF